MSYTIDWQDSIAYKRFQGHVSGDEYCKSTHEIQGDRRFDTLRFIINDYSAVKSHSVVYHDVELVAAHCLGAYKTNPNITVVVVTQAPDIIALVERFREKPLLSWPVKIFSSLPEARHFISGTIRNPI